MDDTDDAVDAPAPRTGRYDPRAELIAQADRLRALLRDDDLSLSARATIEGKLTQIDVAVARYDGAQIGESTIARHPAFARLWSCVMAALAEHPVAARAVVAALEASSP